MFKTASLSYTSLALEAISFLEESSIAEEAGTTFGKGTAS
jgi:hypothetical protein